MMKFQRIDDLPLAGLCDVHGPGQHKQEMHPGCLQLDLACPFRPMGWPSPNCLPHAIIVQARDDLQVHVLALGLNISFELDSKVAHHSIFKFSPMKRKKKEIN